MTASTPPLPLALSMGEPAGIGAEITLKAWLKRDDDGVPPFFIIADAGHLAVDAAALDLGVPLVRIAEPAAAIAAFARGLPVLHRPLPHMPVPGRPQAATAPSVVKAIEEAVRLTQAGQAAAVVTNPIHKKVLLGAGFPFPGHTEFLASLAGGDAHAVMMLAGPSLRVVPVSVHVSLAQAIAGLSAAAIVAAGQATAQALAQDFGIARPRLAIAGLNPHAGEEGAMGSDEQDLIAPAVAVLQAAGIEAFGPVPPDALFTPLARTGYDAAICMYHDQALIPLKALDFDRAVNVTLGLPFVRTSPDHGTAFDIAGKGLASPASLIAALKMAAAIADRRRAGQQR
ncbi:4-hydroxythreonine-4-phosphate dehydrogenase [Candidatus Defluviicoccus seviourii]|uniref:4-hydroxythreonine-4-phosphate dehydrogenase n=1 Tax=Candidatus Defluviicoccus seviourii TaxID=2565273 RepID=A0A564WE02_9PROT|nr:4-hydroxythreonine-4-phosphate dehydrogenase [Candidatus Defluviicoccus seviourii]